jgi:hypothetical protein
MNEGMNRTKNTQKWRKTVKKERKLRVAQNPLTIDYFIVECLPFAFFDWDS